MIVMDNSTESSYVVVIWDKPQKKIESLKKKTGLSAEEKRLLEDFELYKQDLTTNPRQSHQPEGSILRIEKEELLKKYNLASTKELYRWKIGDSLSRGFHVLDTTTETEKREVYIADFLIRGSCTYRTDRT